MTATEAPVGLRYRATRGVDGRYTVHDVPIFGTLPAFERGNEKLIDAKWMQAVIAGHEAEERKNSYLAPVKLTHADNVFKTCYFRPTYIAKMEYEGREIDVLHADLVGVDELAMSVLSSGSYPFRSVEVRDWSVPRINALALLSGDAPYFRFPLMAGVDVADDSVTATFKAGCCAALQSWPRTRSVAAVFRFASDGDRPDTGGKDGGNGSGAGGGEPQHGAPPASAPDMSGMEKILGGINAALKAILQRLGLGAEPDTDPLQQPATRESLDAGAGDEEGHEEPDGDEGGDAAPEAAAGGDDEDDDGDEDEGGKPAKEKAKMSATTDTNKLAAMTAENAKLRADLAETGAKLAAAETRLAEIDRAAKVRELVAAAAARLAAKKVRVANFEKVAEKFAAAGAEVLETFVATLETSGKTDGPDTLEDALRGAPAGGYSEVALRFAAGKPAGTLERAAEESAKFAAFKSKNPNTTVTEDEWLRANVLSAAK